MATRTDVPLRLPRFLFAAALAGGALLLAANGMAQADNAITDSTPAADSEVATQPSAIVMTFENEVPEQTDVQLVCDGNPFASLGDPERGGDNLTLSVELLQPLPAGDCRVAWTLTNADGTTDADTFSFTVSDAAAAAAPAGTPTTTVAGTTPVAATSVDDDSDSSVRDAEDVSSGPIWLGRVLSIVGISVLFGSLVLIVAAWPEGPEYVLALRFLRSAWVVGVVGSLIYVVALAAAVQGEGFGSGLNPASWFDLFDAGWAGAAAVMRVVLVVACGWVAAKPERVIDPTTNMFALGIPALAVVTLGLSRTGGSLAFLGVIASILHVLAMAVWFGGAVLLARVVLAGPGEEDLVHAVRGFGRISNPAIVVTVVSGLLQLYRQVGGELFSSAHGRVLLLKTVAVAAMIFVGLTARQIVTARLARASELNVRVADRLRRAFGTEAVIGLIVLALTGWLLALDPGKLPDDGGGDFEVSDRLEDQALDFDVEVGVNPGRAGLNELEVIVHSPQTGISNLQVTFHPPQGSDAAVVTQPIVGLTTAGRAFSAEGGGVPLDAPGTWRVQVSATVPSGQVNINGAIVIADEEGNVPEPSPLSVDDLPASTSTTTTIPGTVATTA